MALTKNEEAGAIQKSRDLHDLPIELLRMIPAFRTCKYLRNTSFR